jgi:beta-glucosidase
MTNPDTGKPGLVATFRDADGTVLQSDERRSTALVWFDADAPLDRAQTVELRTTLTLPEQGVYHLGFGAHLHARFEIDGEVLIDVRPGTSEQQLGASFSFPPTATVPVSAEAGRPLSVRVVFDLKSGKMPLANALGLVVGSAPDPDADEDDLIAAAVEAARAADVAVVVVGTNSKVESEGRDRSNLRLPGRQDDLVAAVAVANPRTVVVVNSGAPVLLPWSDDVQAVLLGWFGGQEIGRAVADILAGRAEPGGRLPTCWPAELADVPVVDVTPKDGRLSYDEGIHIGYRAWLRAGREPAYPFGHGLGYTTWSFDGADVTTAPDPAIAGTVQVTVRNTGDRPGKQVVQVYAERPNTAVERPVRWLVGFAVVRAAAGESVAVDIPLLRQRFAHWDDGWAVEPGEFRLQIGSSVTDLPLATRLSLAE